MTTTALPCMSRCTETTSGGRDEAVAAAELVLEVRNGHWGQEKQLVCSVEAAGVEAAGVERCTL